MQVMRGVIIFKTGWMRLSSFNQDGSIHTFAMTRTRPTYFGFIVLLWVVATCLVQCHAFAPSRSIRPSIVLSRIPITVLMAQHNTETGTDEKRKQTNSAVLNRGRDFAASIMKDIEKIPESNGMRIMRGVKNLISGMEYNIIIRKITQPFWDECIKEVTTTDSWVRVCAVGTPGIGKTTSTPFLIRMLLQEKHTVVYRLRSEDYFWEFQWNDEDGYVVNVHPEDVRLSDIDCLNKDSTFYIVDPMSTSTSCFPPYSLAARTIIVSSPDETHWGGKEFIKRRERVVGRFRYFPLWTLDELLMARPYFESPALTVAEVEDRFRLFGGVPRHVFSDDQDFRASSQSQDDAISALTAVQAEQIVKGEMDDVGSFSRNPPKTAIVGYAKIWTPEEIPFSSRQVEIVSPLVAEKISKKFMAQLWSLIPQEDKSGWKIFEGYCRELMMTSYGRSFLRRPCCGQKALEYKNLTLIKLGACKEVRVGLNIYKAVVKGSSMTLFHSCNPNQPLIDFIYKDKVGHFHAFQATTGVKHTIQKKLARDLRAQLGNVTLSIYYLTPAENFNKFVTAPANPETDELTTIWHILIPNPNEESDP